MAGGFQFYFDAANTLWDTPSQELYSLARTGDPEAMRRAAEATLRLKAEFMTPEAFTHERAALTKLASALSDDPEFTIDLALRLRGKKVSAPPPHAERIKWVTRRSPRSVLLWIGIIAGVFLLILDVLATAGVPVPTPIGDLIDQFTGTDEPPLKSAPRLDSDPLTTAVAAGPSLVGAAPLEESAFGLRALSERAGSTKTKNPQYQNGKRENYANGRWRNQPDHPGNKHSGKHGKSLIAQTYARASKAPRRLSNEVRRSDRARPSARGSQRGGRRAGP